MTMADFSNSRKESFLGVRLAIMQIKPLRRKARHKRKRKRNSFFFTTYDVLTTCGLPESIGLGRDRNYSCSEWLRRVPKFRNIFPFRRRSVSLSMKSLLPSHEVARNARTRETLKEFTLTPRYVAPHDNLMLKSAHTVLSSFTRAGPLSKDKYGCLTDQPTASLRGPH